MYRSIRVLLTLASLLLVSACNNQQAYYSLQGARENECQKIIDAAQRTQCFDNARQSYDKFEQERNESRSK